MSSRRTAVRYLAFAAALNFAAPILGDGGALAQSAFPRSSLQPTPYSPRPAPSGPIPVQPAVQQPIGAPIPIPPARSPRAVGQTLRVDLGGPEAPSRMMSLPKGKSAVIELPVDARDVLVSDPKVADVVLSTPRRIYVLGVGGGQTDAVFFDAAGRQLLNLNIRVDQDSAALADTLNRLLPNADIHVDGLNGSVVLSGTVANVSDADKAVQLARSTVEKPENVINMLGISESEQVMLKVRIVEVNRSIIKQLGVNLNAVINQVGQPEYTLGMAPTYAVNGSLLGGLTGGYNYNSTTQPESNPVSCNYSVSPASCVTLPQQVIDRNFKLSSVATNVAGTTGVNQAQAMLQAFESVGLVRTLAEPNLTATSGEAAKFLAGGEFPVPTGRDNNGQVTIDFKPYGVGLGFTPVVLSKGRIALKISTEYSEITNVGGFTLATSGAGTTGPSVTIPGLTVRRAETSVELPSGGSMMIAGLLESTTKQTIDSLPGLMELPVLGALFRSRDFQNNETELVVIVTPYLVKAVSPDKLQTPADGLQIASDLQTTLGRLNTASGHLPAKTADDTYRGPYGYVVD